MFMGQFIYFKLIINFIDFNYCLNHFKFNRKLIYINYFIIYCLFYQILPLIINSICFMIINFLNFNLFLLSIF